MPTAFQPEHWRPSRTLIYQRSDVYKVLLYLWYYHAFTAGRLMRHPQMMGGRALDERLICTYTYVKKFLKSLY